MAHLSRNQVPFSSCRLTPKLILNFTFSIGFLPGVSPNGQNSHSQVYLKKPMQNMIKNIEAIIADSSVIVGTRSKAVKRKFSVKALNEVILIEDCEGSATDTEDDNQYEVEKVLNKRKRGGRVHYLVKWLGYGDEDNTWESEDNLDCDEKIAEFEKKGRVSGEKIMRTK